MNVSSAPGAPWSPNWVMALASRGAHNMHAQWLRSTAHERIQDQGEKGGYVVAARRLTHIRVGGALESEGTRMGNAERRGCRVKRMRGLLLDGRRRGERIGREASIGHNLCTVLRPPPTRGKRRQHGLRYPQASPAQPTRAKRRSMHVR